jgi:hypothetical protein
VNGRTLRDCLSDLPGARVVAPPSASFDGLAMPSSSDPSPSCEAPTVDDGPFVVTDVPQLGRTGFTHFLDGAQRSWTGVYVGLTPVYLAHTSAGIVERLDRDVLPPSIYSGDMEAFVPEGSPAAQRISHMLPVVTVGPGDTGMEQAGEQALKRISERREERERVVARSFTEGVLLIDGGIGHMVAADGAKQPFVVGMVKSHRKQYFQSLERTNAIFGMKAGQRSSLFIRQATHSSESDVWSFYLRLHESDQQPPQFGLVRIEVPARDEFRELVDEIAGWVLYERAPLSLPDARYDRMLYPIRLVEQHLKARQPSDAWVRGIMGV